MILFLKLMNSPDILAEEPLSSIESQTSREDPSGTEDLRMTVSRFTRTVHSQYGFRIQMHEHRVQL